MNAASIAKTLKAKGQAIKLIHAVSPPTGGLLDVVTEWDAIADFDAMTLTGGTYDPVAGSVTGATTTTYTVYGIETAFRDGLAMSAGTLIQSGDRQAVVAADQATPIPGDSLTIGGIVWKVIAVTPVNPAGTALLFKLHIRKG